MTINEMIQKRAKVWETAKNFVDTHEDKNGVLSAEDSEAYSRMEKEIEDLTAAIDRQQRAEAREAELSRPVNAPLTGRPAKQEVDEIICWLTGYDEAGLAAQLEKDVDYGAFFSEAPQMNPNCELIKGVVCGVRVENIEDPTMQKIRWLDKLVDELAKGKPMEKILRK